MTDRGVCYVDHGKTISLAAVTKSGLSAIKEDLTYHRLDYITKKPVEEVTFYTLAEKTIKVPKFFTHKSIKGLDTRVFTRPDAPLAPHHPAARGAARSKVGGSAQCSFKSLHVKETYPPRCRRAGCCSG